MKKALAALTVPLVLPLILSACYVPERFSAKVDVKENGDYGFQYIGTLVNGLAASELKQQGKLATRDDAAWKADTAQMLRDHDVRKATYLGKGRYEVKVSAQRKHGDALHTLDTFDIVTDPSGITTIASKELKPTDVHQIEGLGIGIAGTLTVTLPANADVLSQNATAAPKVAGHGGTYVWKIAGPAVRPMLKFKLQ